MSVVEHHRFGPVAGYRFGFDFDALVCGHNPVASGGKRRLQDKLRFLEDFLRSVAHPREQGLPAAGIVRRMDTGRDRLVKRVTLGNAGFANRVRSAVEAADRRGHDKERYADFVKQVLETL